MDSLSRAFISQGYREGKKIVKVQPRTLKWKKHAFACASLQSLLEVAGGGDYIAAEGWNWPWHNLIVICHGSVLCYRSLNPKLCAHPCMDLLESSEHLIHMNSLEIWLLLV